MAKSRGQRIKELRVKRELTQAELAAKVGVARNTITRVEIGNRLPSLRLLERLAKALGVKLTEVV